MSPSGLQNVTTGAQNMCVGDVGAARIVEPFGPLPDQVEVPVRDRVGRVLQVHDPRVLPPVVGLREVRRRRRRTVRARRARRPAARTGCRRRGRRSPSLWMSFWNTGPTRSAPSTPSRHVVDVVERLLGAVTSRGSRRTATASAASSAGIVARRSCTALIISRPAAAALSTSTRNEIQLGRYEYCSPTSAVSPLYMYSSGLAASFVDPARPGRREDADDLARPRVGAVELLQREVDPFVD